MVDTPNGTDNISMTDAISLLNTPTEDTATVERNEAEDQPQQPEAEAQVSSEDQAHDAPEDDDYDCLLYTSPSPRDGLLSRMPSSA